MNYFDNGQEAVLRNTRVGTLADVNPLLRLVYLWMSLGLLVTAGVSFAIAQNEQFVFSIARAWYVIVFLQLGLVLGLSWGIRRVSPAVATGLFFVYAGSVGLTLGVIFYALVKGGEGMAIAKAFFTTAGLFGAMTVVGFTTKVDLSKFSTFFMMGLIGLVIAIIVNMFLRSDGLSFIISVVGVLLFTALTAWDTQKIKMLAMQPELQTYSDDMRKLSILGALELYLDFINLFIFLLRLFAGNRR